MNFKIIKIRSAGALKFVKDMLVPDGAYQDKEQMLDAIQKLYDQDESKCYGSLAIDEDSNSVVMFILAFVGDVDTVFGIQTCISPLLKSNGLRQKMFDLFFDWCEVNLIKKIKVDSRRHPVAYFTAYNFENIYSIYELDLTKEKLNAPSADTVIQYSDTAAATVDDAIDKERGNSGTTAEPRPSSDIPLYPRLVSDTAVAAV